MAHLFSNVKLARLVIYIATIGLCACAENSDSEVALSPSIQDSESVTLDFNYGKPGAPVSLTYQVPKNSQPGSLVDVQLQFKSATSTGQLSIELNAESGLNLISSNSATFDLAVPAKSMSAQVFLEQDGLFNLNISVQEYDIEGTALMGRSFAVPIQVGSVSAKLKTNGSMIDDGEEKIIEMITE